MDPKYDIAQAGISLLRYTEEREADVHSGMQILNMFKDDLDDALAVSEYNGIGRLIAKQLDQDSAEAEAESVEMVASMQGIITAKELPPFRGRINPSKAYFFRQAVTIAIVDDTVCDRVLEQIGRVQNIFKRQYGDNLIDSCGFATTVTGPVSYNTFDISNRLFKKKSDANGEPQRMLGSSVDPDGTIQTAGNASGLVHTADNEVFYFERKKDAVKGQYKFVTAEPTIFQIGDIVEVQLSFVALPLHQRKRRLSLLLRSIGLMDAKYSKDLSLSKFKSGARNNTAVRPMLKRAVGYSEENVSIAESRMAGMEVDDRAVGRNSGDDKEGGDGKRAGRHSRPDKKRD
ncbi:hypothetical protein CVT24_001333 [Panaeolus cyanescens]|uniref:Uncharacterized protein n=1 Tax=Panaeolus cyanescens TaxID=181874 RepID=A0A409W6Y6_9AGAR|nr:hypothetical protein CVT24_001333 [Panaeolus cyanescens]